MELQFRNMEINCLKRQNWDCREQEQTQELRISDGLPDIGRVICAWGQVVIRSKQWSSSGAEVSGGIMAWVLCKGEDTEELFCVDSWIPFRTRWELPEGDRDGTVLVAATLKGVEARTLSARKLMIRADLHIAAEAVISQKHTVCQPENAPEDLSLLEKKKEVCISVEAGEKPFSIEDTLDLPGATEGGKILRCALCPEVTERKVIGGKAVFRGACQLHVLYMTPEGKLCHQDYALPFSQFAELERDYEDSARLWVIPAVTGLEYEITGEGKLELRSNLTIQYRVDDMVCISYLDDAYSVRCRTELKKGQLSLACVGGGYEETIQPEGIVETLGRDVLDVAMYTAHPSDHSLSGHFQVLYTDLEDGVQTALIPWQVELEQGCTLGAAACGGQIRSGFSGGISASGRILVQGMRLEEEILEYVEQVRMAEQFQPDVNRPSLILCRSGGASLWELGKKFGTTVEAICAANGLEEDSDPERLLLIPIP